MESIIYGWRLGYWEDDVTTQYWDESKAFEAHNNGTMYEVQYGSVHKPIWYMIVKQDSIDVSLFDNYLNVPLVYAFKRLKDGTLFRDYTMIRECGQSSDSVLKATLNLYDRQKRLCTIVYHDKRGFESSRKVVPFNLEDNILPYPEFGQYEKLLDPNFKVYL